MDIEQAKILRFREELHHGTCTRTVGPRGGVRVTISAVRVNGDIKTWKTDPSRIRIPIKIGFYGYGSITQENLDQFHRASECPILHPVDSSSEELKLRGTTTGRLSSNDPNISATPREEVVSGS